MSGVEEEFVECPYDEGHRMLRSRLQQHLIRCRKNHPEVELQKCPFNILHLIPEKDYVSHITTCPDKKIISQYKYCLKDDSLQKDKIKHSPIKGDENWED